MGCDLQTGTQRVSTFASLARQLKPANLPSGESINSVLRISMGKREAEGKKPTEEDRCADPGKETGFAHRVAVAVGIVVLFAMLVALIWQTVDVVLMVFAGVLFGLILHAAAERVSRLTHLKHGWAVLITLLLLCIVIGGVSWLAAPRISDQVTELRQRLPEAIQRLVNTIQQTNWGKYLLQKAPSAADVAASTGKLFSSLGSVFSKTINVVVGMLVIFVVTLYTAVNPQVYVHGLLRLVPKNNRARAREILQSLGHTLRFWMLGQLCSMAIVGPLTGLGLWLLGIPLALLIGLLAGILDFVPIVGTILSAIPALLLGFLESPAKALYVLLLYTGIHQAEAHLILPLIQQRAVSLPPVITIVTLVLLDRLFGFLGLFLAAPIAATVILLVRMIYVEDILGDTGE